LSRDQNALMYIRWKQDFSIEAMHVEASGNKDSGFCFD
jgi:hypothetical protein